jgi:hypothetical protein
MKVLFKKIDAVHIDVGVMGDFVRCKCLCSIDRVVLAMKMLVTVGAGFIGSHIMGNVKNV